MAEGPPLPPQEPAKSLNSPVAEALSNTSPDSELSSLLNMKWEDIPRHKFKTVIHENNGQMREIRMPKEVAQRHLLLLGLEEAFLTEEQIRNASFRSLTDILTEQEERNYKATLGDADILGEEGEYFAITDKGLAALSTLPPQKRHAVLATRYAKYWLSWRKKDKSTGEGDHSSLHTGTTQETT